MWHFRNHNFQFLWKYTSTNERHFFFFLFKTQNMSLVWAMWEWEGNSYISCSWHIRFWMNFIKASLMYLLFIYLFLINSLSAVFEILVNQSRFYHVIWPKCLAFMQIWYSFIQNFRILIWRGILFSSVMLWTHSQKQNLFILSFISVILCRRNAQTGWWKFLMFSSYAIEPVNL